MPDVVARVGIDRNPLDPADPDDRAWLRALIWPGPNAAPRRDRLDAAAAIAAAEPATVLTGDLVDRLPAALEPDCPRTARRWCSTPPCSSTWSVRGGRSSPPWCTRSACAGSPRSPGASSPASPRDLGEPRRLRALPERRRHSPLTAPHGGRIELAVTGRGPGGSHRVGESVGVGPWPGRGPTDPRYDPQLLAEGDRRNVVDRYRYWTVEAIVADLDTRRHAFHVAIENWQHDFNIGTVVRTANAFLAAEVHIVGSRRWNRRGAMVTDRYQHVRHHADVAGLLAFAAAHGAAGGRHRQPARAPSRWRRPTCRERCVLLFGQEGPGLPAAAREAAAHDRLDRPVRLDPLDQRRGRGRHRDARLDPPARRPRCRRARTAAGRGRCRGR